MSIWLVLNIVLLGLSVWTGYGEMAPDLLSRKNPDAIFCTIAFVAMIGASFAAVAYSISGAGQQTLRRPSLSRFSIDWWHDPLQCLFLSCAFTGGMALGAAIRLPGTSTTGFWEFMFFLCLFAGLLIGQLGVYLVYRERIAEI
jgi:hypothetical protein